MNVPLVTADRPPATARSVVATLLLVVAAFVVTGCSEQQAGHPITPPAQSASDPQLADSSAPPPGANATPQAPSTEVPGAAVSDATTAVNTQSKLPKKLPPSKALEPDKPSDGKTLAKSFDDIKFDIEPDAPYDREMLTDEIEALDEERIRIRGYILPTAQKRGIKMFVLVRDNMECCFGPGAALYDCILVEMVPGETAEFTTRPVAVEGDFKIKEFPGPDGRPLAIYRMRGEKVEK